MIVGDEFLEYIENQLLRELRIHVSREKGIVIIVEASWDVHSYSTTKVSELKQGNDLHRHGKREFRAEDTVKPTETGFFASNEKRASNAHVKIDG